MRLKCGNNATSASEGFACCLYPSGQPWEWMTAPSVLVGHQGIPFHTMNLWLHFGCTCIFHLYHCNRANGYSDHFSILFSSLLFNDLAVSPLKPQSSKHLQTPSPSKQQLQGCDPWDELGRQKHRGKVYGQSVCFSWQIQSTDFSFSRWQVSFKMVSASQNILQHFYLTAPTGLLARPSHYCHMCLCLSVSTWIVWTDFIRTTLTLKAHCMCKH